MTGPRSTPLAAVFGAGATERFARLRAGLEREGADPGNRDAFSLVREVAELLHELHGEPRDAAALQGMVAFLHHAFQFWLEGERVSVVSEAVLAAALSTPPTSPTPPSSPSRYVQLPPLRIWGEPRPDAPAEPLDGWFGVGRASELSVLAIFGLSPARPGFTAVEVSGPRASALARPDGTPLFASRLPGGAVAGLASLAGEEELLELAWRLAGSP